MSDKSVRITATFAPDTQFEIEAQTDPHTLHAPDLLVLPLEDQRINVLLKPLESRGVPFSALND
jgi:hypothetical protein